MAAVLHPRPLAAVDAVVGAGAVVGAAGAGAEVLEAIPEPVTPAAEALAAVVEARPT